MDNKGYTFETIIGTYITVNISLNYAKTIIDLFDSRSKTERNHKRKVQNLINSSEDVIKATDFLLNHKNIRELADIEATSIEATSIETVLFLASNLDVTKREKVINYIHELNE